MLEHEHQAMAQTLRVLARQRHAQPHVRIRQRDHQAMHVRHLASDPGPGHAEIDLHAARRPLEPHVPLAIRHAAVRLAPPVHVTHRGRILAVVIRLRQQTVVHAPDRVPLLPGQQTIGLQPLVHQMRVRVDLRPVPAIRLRLGRAILHIRVLRDRPAIHVKTPRYLRARHSLPVESPDILHNGHRYRHVPFLPERRPAATGRIKTDWQLGNIQAAAPMPITSPGNDDDTGENHQPTLRKNTAEPVEQTLKQNTATRRCGSATSAFTSGSTPSRSGRWTCASIWRAAGNAGRGKRAGRRKGRASRCACPSRTGPRRSDPGRGSAISSRTRWSAPRRRGAA
ncbi:hypothetical protein BLIF_1795 [Bifidobacterium longum subsp. infantis 157F]|nr:hypothetical protein BLIF_1795 [Bifidobacterium longum subsp. infantis 157F]